MSSNYLILCCPLLLSPSIFPRIRVFSIVSSSHKDFPGASDCKSICLQCGRPGFDLWVGKIPCKKTWQPNPVFLPGEPHGLYPRKSPGQNTAVGSLSLLQGIFPTQGSNPGLPHCRWILYQLSHKGSPWISKCWLKGFSWFQQADIGMLPSEKLHQFTCQPNISILWIPRLLPTPFAFHNYTQPTVRMYYIKCLRGPCKIN